MATRIISRSILGKLSSSSSSSFSFSLSSPCSSAALLRLRPLSSAVLSSFRRPSPSLGRAFSSRASQSSLNDSNPNWSNRPPKETILLDGCDFEHWLIVMEKPEGEPSRDDIIDSYIKTLAQVVGSEEEARMKIYSVSTRHYFAFGALVSEELSYKIKELPRVRWVLPDSYLDVKNKDYGGEPFINGVAVPYDPKYHEEWVRNNARANERNRRNDRPRNFDRSRNFERRRENVQSRDFQSRDGPPMPNQNTQNLGPPQNWNGPPQANMVRNTNPGPPQNWNGPPQANMGRNMGQQGNMGHPQGNMGTPQGNMGAPQGNMGVPQGNMGGAPPNYMGGAAPNYSGGAPPNYSGGVPPNYSGGAPPNYTGGAPPNNLNNMPSNNMGGYQPNNTGGMPPNDMGGYQQNMGQNRGYSNNPGPQPNNAPSNMESQNSYAQNNGGIPGGANTYNQ